MNCGVKIWPDGDPADRRRLVHEPGRRMLNHNKRANRTRTGVTPAMCIQQHPYFSDGWHDALYGEPLFDDADPIYAEGWRSFWRFRKILGEIDDGERSDASQHF